MTDRSAEHWYPTAAYLYVLHLNGPALAWEYLRRNPGYRRDWLRRRRWPDAAQAWGLRLLEDPALDARDAHPAWFPDHDAVVQLPDADPPPEADAFEFWRVPGRKQLIHDGKRLVLVSHWPAACGSHSRLAWKTAWLSLRHPCLCRALRTLPCAGGRAGCAVRRPWPRLRLRPVPGPRRPRCWSYTLQALDATLAGASLREVAEGLFGADAVAADWHGQRLACPRAAVGAPWRGADARRLSQPGATPASCIAVRGRFAPAIRPLARSLAFLKVPLSGRVWPGLMEVHPMRPAPLRPCAAAPAQPQRYLTNDEAAEYLRLSPRTLEKQRVIGGGPKFRSSAAASCMP